MSSKLFDGRLMTCSKCGFKFRSSKGFSSMWTTVEVEGHLMDFCPFCWGIPRKEWPEQVKVEWDKFQTEKQRKNYEDN